MAKQKKLEDGFQPDLARYRKASEPHKSIDAMKEACHQFYDELSELRVKYQVRDLYVIYNFAVIEDDGSESISAGTTGFGNPSLFLPMAATAYGIEKEAHEELMRKMISGKHYKKESV